MCAAAGISVSSEFSVSSSNHSGKSRNWFPDVPLFMLVLGFGESGKFRGASR